MTGPPSVSTVAWCASPGWMQAYSLFRPTAGVSLVSLFTPFYSPFLAPVLHLQTAHHAYRSAYHLRGTVPQPIPVYSRWTLMADCRRLVPRHRLAGLPLRAVTPSSVLASQAPHSVITGSRPGLSSPSPFTTMRTRASSCRKHTSE